MAKKVEIKDGGVMIDDNGTQSFISQTNKDLGSNFQYVKNPTTGAVLALGKDAFAKYGQDLANVGFNPVGADIFNQTKTETPISQSGTTNTNPLGEYKDLNISTDNKISTSGVFSSMTDFETKKAAEKAKIESAAETSKLASQKAIESQYSPYIEEAEQYREDITKATKGQFATDRRASTAALSFVDSRRAEAQKQINKLVEMKNTALANLDVATQEKIDKQLKDWQDYELQLAGYFRQVQQDTFNQKMAELGYNLDIAQFEESKKTGELNRQTTQASLDKTLRDNYLDNLNNIISSGLTSDKIANEDKSKYEKSLGLPSGTFDTWYGKMKDLQELKEAGNVLTLNKTINDILKDVPEDTTINLLGQDYQGLKKSTSDTSNLDYIKDLLDIKIKQKNLAGELDIKDKAQMEVAARKDLMKFGSDPLEAINKLDLFEISYQEAKKAGLDDTSLNPASQAMVTYFNKLLDPTSVVRESEYARVGEGQSLWNRISGTYDKLVQGGAGISQKELAEFSKFGLQLVSGYRNQFIDTITPIWEQTSNYGLNANNIFTPKMQSWITESEAKNLNSTEDLFSDFE